MIRRRRKEDLVPYDYWNRFFWSPWSMLDEMDRLFDDFRSGFENFLVLPRNIEARALRSPVVDLVDEGKEYRLMAEIPGIKKEDLNIEVTEKEIEITAETKVESKEEDESSGYLRRERRYSKFYRRIPVPASVNTDEISAELKDGVLTVRLPKRETPEEKAKKIKVK